MTTPSHPTTAAVATTPQPHSAVSRRRFLVTTAVAAGASSLSLVRPARGQAPASKVTLALMGAGGRGSELCRKFAEIPGVEFKYLCDPNSARGGDLLRELEKKQAKAPQRIKDIRQALEDKDLHAVVIATPEQWHALAAIWACQAGKDVTSRRTCP